MIIRGIIILNNRTRVSRPLQNERMLTEQRLWYTEKEATIDFVQLLQNTIQEARL